MIEYQKKLNNWKFISLGTNAYALTTIRKVGINHNFAVNYNKDKKKCKFKL